MVLRRLALCVVAAAAFAAFQVAQAQPLRGCPEGQAVQSLHPNGTPVGCITVPRPVDLAPLNAAIRALEDSQSSPITRCYIGHFVRRNGTEVRFTVLTFSNGDLHNEAVIDRITVRSSVGQIIHDSGPKAGVPHPLAQGPLPPRDITTVPPGGSFSLSTSDIWGFNPIPGFENAGLELISVHVEVAKGGKPSLVQVSSREIVRDRIVTDGVAASGNERAANSAPCFPVPPQS
jgi:hypothetical protein